MADGLERSRAWLEGMPEIGILRGVSRAVGEPIRIRGGVARNLLARAVRTERTNESAGPTHLVDLVDPLSDIDVVVSRADMIPIVFGHIFRRIALAGFVRWEGKTAAQVEHFERTGLMTHLDGIEIEITPAGAHLSRAENALRDLEDGRIHRRSLEREPSRQEADDVDGILFALRAARFATEFGLEFGDEFEMPVAKIRRGRNVRISVLDTLRLDLAALDILLTAPTPEAARRGMQQIHTLVPPWLRRQSRILMQLGDAPLDQPLRVISYPRLGSQPPRVRLETYVKSNAALSHEPTLLPWTAIRLPRFGEGACCPPDDFMLGPLVIAWRGVTLPRTEIGVVALAPPADPYETPSRFVFGVPGIVEDGSTVVQRLDWGFARYLAGDGRLVYFGARSAMKAEVTS